MKKLLKTIDKVNKFEVGTGCFSSLDTRSSTFMCAHKEAHTFRFNPALSIP